MDHPTSFCCCKKSLGKAGVFCAGWLKGLCIWKRSRQQLNNLYWVTYKSFICCDQVQLYFEPWTDEASNGEIYFQIKVSHNRKDLVGWLLSFISNQENFQLQGLPNNLLHTIMVRKCLMVWLQQEISWRSHHNIYLWRYVHIFLFAWYIFSLWYFVQAIWNLNLKKLVGGEIDFEQNNHSHKNSWFYQKKNLRLVLKDSQI